MNLFWKITLSVLSLLLLLVFVAGIWFYNAYLNIDNLDVSTNDTKQDKIEKIDSWFEKLHGNNQFNGSVLLMKSDSIFFKKAYGYEDCSKENKLTTNSIFRLASVSKQFTAAGIMLLHESGKLNFDDFLVQHIPNFPFPDVTIRHLLNQTSGIPDVYMEYPDKYPQEVGDLLTIEKMLEIFLNHPPKGDIKANEKFEYSNTNYVLLAALIEKISSLSYENFMKSHLFEPMGMHSSRVWNLLSVDKNFVNKAQDLERTDDECVDITPGILDGVAGDGAVFSSVEDFVIWSQFWNSNILISDETMKEAFILPELNDGSKSDYGFGWILQNDTTWHNGAWLGAASFFLRDTKNKRCFVLLDNSSNVENIEKIGLQLRMKKW